MEAFISQYPGVVIGIMGMLGGTISLLIAIILWFLQRTINNLAQAIHELRLLIDSLHVRMKAVEVRCDETRKHCPVENQ